MLTPSDSNGADDPYNLSRFLQGQEGTYERALMELRGGYKRSHWMWFIFPQLQGLALSPNSQFYAIKSIEEARAYLAHPVLGSRLIECAEALLQIHGRSAEMIMGHPDDAKLNSCATLFALASDEGSVFEQLLAKYFEGERDERTLELLGLGASESEHGEGETAGEGVHEIHSIDPTEDV